MHKHALGVELHTPIVLCGKLTSELVLLNVVCTQQEAELLTTNALNAINTNKGIYLVSVSDEVGNPLNPQRVIIDISNIKEVYKIVP
ncbi:MAG: hypothetical protein JFR39_03010 [Muribaculaceae bacterium]|nr:hypothetical protein [Muribaculaceae bacterium]